jgi:formamidase
LPLSLVATANYVPVVPGHNRWHPDIPAVAEVISGGSIRLECQGLEGQGRSAPGSATGEEEDPASDAVLCGPVAILGAEPGDILVIDILGVGRGEHGEPFGHPGIIGCAPPHESIAALAAVPAVAAPKATNGVLLGHLRPGPADYLRIAAQAIRSPARGKEIARCAIAPLVTGSRVLLPVHARAAKLSAGDLHFPIRPVTSEEACRGSATAGWIDLRINLTKRGMERFRVTGPKLMSEPAGP